MKTKNLDRDCFYQHPRNFIVKTGAEWMVFYNGKEKIDGWECESHELQKVEDVNGEWMSVFEPHPYELYKQSTIEQMVDYLNENARNYHKWSRQREIISLKRLAKCRELEYKIEEMEARNGAV